MRYRPIVLLIVLALALPLLPMPSEAQTALSAAAAAVPGPDYAIAMHGAPALPPGFTHFTYADPDAPQGGTLKLGALGTFDSLNPFIIRGQPPLGLGTGNFGLVYESLMARNWDEPFTLYGLLAETVEVPDDRSSIVFNLNPAAHWQDGQPVTADDVLFSYETLRDHGRPNHRLYYKKVASAEKLADRRVKFTFRPNDNGVIDREMPLIMALMPILPRHDWQDRAFNQTTQRPPIGSGPYSIGTVDPGRSVTYMRDPGYWGKDVPAQRGLYNFASVRVDYYRDDGVALQAFKAGQYDWRREANPNKWADAYASPALDQQRLSHQAFPHRRTEPMRGFIFNTRRPLLHDPALRLAMSYAFDSGWIGANLFHGLMRRTESFFPNSDLAATGLPDGAELACLEPLRDQLPRSIFTKPPAAPSTDGTEASLRANLLAAAVILKTAGYTIRDGLLYPPLPQPLPQGEGSSKSSSPLEGEVRWGGVDPGANANSGDTSFQPLHFEILLADPADEKIALAWARTLARLGITVTVRTADSAQYQQRLTAFDYDITVNQWFNSQSPGNEQMLFWGSAAAHTPGSRNYAGVDDPAVDALAAAIPAARSREALTASTRALDRVLLSGHYAVPFFYWGADPVAYWTTRVGHPASMPLYGPILETWWSLHQ